MIQSGKVGSSAVCTFALWAAFLAAAAPAHALLTGTGADGPLVVSATTTIDTVRTSVAGIASGTSIPVVSSAGFSVGDELLIIGVQGGTVGFHEFGTVSGVGAGSITVSNPLVGAYDSGAGPVAVQRVPNYTDVVVEGGGLLTATPFDGATGGIVAFRATGTVQVQDGGAISAEGLGYRGGPEVMAAGTSLALAVAGIQGESIIGLGLQSELPNVGGGGGGRIDGTSGDVGGGGGGGGYGTFGAEGGDGNSGGTIIRDAGGFAGAPYGGDLLTQLLFGSGGGSGGAELDSGTGFAGAGGAGGGIVYVHANTLQLLGDISARGAAGGDDGTNSGSESGGGGGGAGGSLLIETGTLLGVLDPVAALMGGVGGNTVSNFPLAGGTGGFGRGLFNNATLAPQFVQWNPANAETLNNADGFGTATWIVSPEGHTAGTPDNSDTTVLLSGQNILNTRIRGTITPVGLSPGAGEDDFVGLVLGFNPGDSANPDAQYLLLDWKGATQSFDFTGGVNDLTPGSSAPAGLALSLVTGIPNADELWGHDDAAETASGGVQELARALTLGSSDYGSESYFFDIMYTEDQVLIFVNGNLEFAVSGQFLDGQLGLYEGYQDPGAQFSGFSISPLLTAQQQVPEPATALTLLGAMGMLTWRRRRAAA